MPIRQYSSRSQQSTLTSAITAGAATMTVVNGSALMGGQSIPAGRTFTLVIDVDTALEEIVDATAVSTNTFTITRAIDGSSAQSHSAGAVVRHMAIGRDYRDANLHTQAAASYNDGAGNAQSMHGIASGEGDVVGTDKAQTLTNKTLTSPTISNPTFTGTPLAAASISFEGATADDYETILTVVDPTQDNTITLPNTTGTVVIVDATQTLTNKTLTSPTISGSPVITGLSSAGMSASSATPKDYVDAILGSATAAATSAASAATSAASAATSATSASNSATASATSASAAATSATSAATSATSAAASATAAATSATSAAASEAGVTASASAAATSAASASTSASSALTSANSASTSASSAQTFASTMAASVTAAASSATAAATSATSAAASATAAATSASSAATSASSALTSANSANADAITAAASVASIAGYATDAINSASAAATSAASAAASTSAAAASATSAATSATSAATSATSAAASYDSFDDRYLGAKSSPPTLDNDGQALLTGALYWNTGDNQMYVWSGSAWIEISSTAALFRFRFTATGGETSESGVDDNGNTLSYLVGKEQVYLNGVLLVRAQDYTATNGTSIASLSPALAANDVLEIITFTAFDVATAIPNSLFDAKGDLLVATSADTPGKITVASTNGYILSANSATATGLEWIANDQGDLTAVTAGTGITVTNSTGPIPTVAFDYRAGSAVTLNAQTASYTLVLADADQKLVTLSVASANTVSIPTNASVAYPTGSVINVIQIGAGQTTIQASSSGTTTIQSTGAATAAPKLRAQYSAASCIKVATDTWYVVGDIA